MRAVIEALQSLRGIAQTSAVSIMAELGELSRFAHQRKLIGYSGALSREHSSGECIRRGTISKAGNAYLRRIVIEAAWAYRHRPAVGETLAARQRRAHGIGLEGSASPASALRAADRTRQVQSVYGHGRGARAPGLHLRGRRAGRARTQRAATRSGPRRPSHHPRTDSVKSASRQRLWRQAVKENPRQLLCGRLLREPALLVERQLPMDHDHDGERSRSIHEYQTDQPSHIAATAAAGLRLSLHDP